LRSWETSLDEDPATLALLLRISTIAASTPSQYLKDECLANSAGFETSLTHFAHIKKHWTAILNSILLLAGLQFRLGVFGQEEDWPSKKF